MAKTKKRNPVDVINYGKRTHYNTREEAIAFYEECILGTEGSERERYLDIYMQLKNTNLSEVSDGDPEHKEETKKPDSKTFEKDTLLKRIENNDNGVLYELYDMKSCSLRYYNREVILALLKQHGWYAAQFLNKYIDNDKDCIKAACLGGTETSSSLRYASHELRNDKNFVCELIDINCENFAYASENLKNDKDVVRYALTKAANTKYLEYIKKNIGTKLLMDTFCAIV